MALIYKVKYIYLLEILTLHGPKLTRWMFFIGYFYSILPHMRLSLQD